MNYQNISDYNTAPPGYKKNTSKYNNDGTMIPLDQNNMSQSDIFKTSFLFLQDHPDNYQIESENALKGILPDSELSKLFFSKNNISRIQKMIKREVLIKTKRQFKLEVDQDPKDLFIVMRAVYIEYAKNIPDKIVHQVKQLNNKVIETIIPDVLTMIKQEYNYLKDINEPLQVLPRPMNVNHAGRKALPSITTIYNN